MIRIQPRTDAQKEASRLNGGQSHGPVTPEGKAISSANARRHGLLSNSILLPAESKEEFQRTLDSFIDEFDPQTESELVAVEQLTVARWRQIRNWSLLTTGHSLEISDRAANDPSLVDRGMAAQAWLAHKHLGGPGNPLDLLHRYERSFGREFRSLLRELNEKKEKRDRLERL